MAKGNVVLSGDGNAKQNFTHTTDIAKIVSAVLKQNKTGTIQASGTYASEREVLAIFEKVTGKKFNVTQKNSQEWKKQEDAATDFFPGKFVPYLRRLILDNKINSFVPNFQFGKTLTIEEFAKQFK